MGSTTGNQADMTTDLDRLTQVDLELSGIGKEIERHDPLWSLAWQRAKALRLDYEQEKANFRGAIAQCHKYGLPIQKCGKPDYTAWKDVPIGEHLCWDSWTYRVRP